MKTKLIKFHFIILLILVVNFIIMSFFGVGLNNYTIIGLKILLYGSAIISFITLLDKFIAIYFSLYLISPVIIAVVKMEGSILGATLGSLFISLIYTPFPLYEQGNYGIRHEYSLKDSDSQYEVYEEYTPFIKPKGKFNYTLHVTNKEGEEIEKIAPVLESREIGSIKIEKDSIFIEFEDNSSRSFKLY